LLVDEPVEGLEFPELAEELLPPEEELPELAGALAATAAGLAAIELLGVPLVELEVTETLAFEEVDPPDELTAPSPEPVTDELPFGFATLTVCPMAALMAAPRLVLAASTALLVAAAGSSALAASVPPKVTAAATPIP